MQLTEEIVRILLTYMRREISSEKAARRIFSNEYLAKGRLETLIKKAINEGWMR